MTNHTSAPVGCLLVGEYVDEAGLPAQGELHRGEAVRPQTIACYLDLWAREDGVKVFTVLLKDGRVVAVRGHGLKPLPDSVTGEGLLYGIVTRTADGEAFVALFKSSEVVGIFHGELCPDRKMAS
jgi:hypothetical protein